MRKAYLAFRFLAFSPHASFIDLSRVVNEFA